MERQPSLAARVFASWLRSQGTARAAVFDATLDAHPECADELAALHRRWLELEPVLRLTGLGPSGQAGLAERLRLAHGAELDPEVSLEGAGPEEEPKGTSGLLRRLDRDTAESRYRLEGEIARGGMGAILKVWDGDIRRHLAMKVVLGDAPGAGEASEVDPLLLARFLEEAQVTGQLDHPGIVPVHELGLDPDGRAYFTMKLVKGRDLRAIYELCSTSGEGWNETRALGVLLKVCEAMAYAHKKGVIHRDLKPANVMVGYFGEVYVMDWGLARVLGRADRHDLRIAPERAVSRSVRTDRREEREETPDSPIVTMDGDVVGTPAYMSPEQARGEVGELDARSDVYAIGAMLYHLLAGQMPYVPPGTRVSARTLLGMVIQGPPSPLASLRKDAPAELVAICEKAMARAAARRYADTLELAEDLRAYLEHRVVRAYRTGAWIELRKWVRRNRGTAAALAAVVLAVAGGAIVTGSVRASASRRELLLSDVRRAEGLLAEVDRLWPALPGQLPELRGWLSDARGLESHRDEHEQLLRVLESEDPEGAPASNLRAFLREQAPVVRALVDQIAAREELAGSVEALTRSSPEAQARWRAAIDAIAKLPAYRGLQLSPQLGLLPLAADPHSGLWEFWHALSGDAPALDRSTGRWQVAAETGIVLVLVPGGPALSGSLPVEPRPKTMAEAQARLEELEAAGSAYHDPFHDKNEGFLQGIDLAPFFLSKYEMTQGQWTRLMGSNPSQNRALGPIAPVETVTWNDAVEALRRAALELPTEVQWEHACRAGTSSPFWTGWRIASLNGAANIGDLARKGSTFATGYESVDVDDGEVGVALVGRFRPNPFGFHDIHGNVWEWCRDGFRDERSPRDGDGFDVAADAHPARAIRGGSFSANGIEARSSNRFRLGYLRISADSDLGVRPARAIE